jgi:flagella basal body P-ring formation protein FlgA
MEDPSLPEDPNVMPTHTPNMNEEAGTSLRRLIVLAAALVMTWVAAGRANAQDTITLRASAQADPAQPLRLRDLADLNGPSAEQLGAVVIDGAWAKGTEPGGWSTISIDAVRSALKAHESANWARLVLRGSSCVVRRNDQPAETAASSAPAAPACVSAAPATTGSDSRGTLRALILTRLAAFVGDEPANLRLTFEERDAAVLATSLAGRTAEINPTGSADRIPVAVRIYEHDRLVASATIRVQVEVKRRALIARAPLKRGDVLRAADVAEEERWMLLTAEPASVHSLGSIVRGRVTQGQVIRAADLEPATVIRKGDLVSVSCISGSIVVRTTGRALEDGKVGEVIRLEKQGSKKPFNARVAGPGRAVTVAAGSDEPAPQAAPSATPSEESAADALTPIRTEPDATAQGAFR